MRWRRRRALLAQLERIAAARIVLRGHSGVIVDMTFEQAYFTGKYGGQDFTSEWIHGPVQLSVIPE